MVQKGTFYGDNDGTVMISTAAVAGLLYHGQPEMELLVPKLVNQAFGMLRTGVPHNTSLAMTKNGGKGGSGVKIG